MALVNHPRGWQTVIHGDGLRVRRIVCESMLKLGMDKSAVRYAFCGTQDVLVADTAGVHVRPKGCGHALCPRCGRRRGGIMARKAMGWLAHEPHGTIVNACFTQNIIRGETLAAARRRLSAKVRGWMRWATRRGLVGALTVHHIVWSKSGDGWHYHAHAVIDFGDAAVTYDELDAQWQKEVREAGEPYWGGAASNAKRLFAVRVAEPGPAVVALKEDSGDAEFWSEATDGLARSLQYPMRDMAQGVSAWRLGGDDERMAEVVEELLTTAKGWKLRRAWGRWRKTCPGVTAAKEANSAKAKEIEESGFKRPCIARAMGTVGRVWIEARRGSAAAKLLMKQLEKSVRNDSTFAKRLVRYARMAWIE